MATARPSAARVATGATALAVAGAIAATNVTTESRFAALVALLSGAGAGLTVLGTFLGWSALAVPAALSLGAGFAVTRYGTAATLDVRAVPVAVGLLVLCELVAWSSESRTAVPPGVSPAVRSATLATVVAVAGGLTAIVGAIATVPVRDAVVLVALGVSAVALVALVLLRLAAAASRS